MTPAHGTHNVCDNQIFTARQKYCNFLCISLSRSHQQFLHTFLFAPLASLIYLFVDSLYFLLVCVCVFGFFPCRSLSFLASILLFTATFSHTLWFRCVRVCVYSFLVGIFIQFTAQVAIYTGLCWSRRCDGVAVIYSKWKKEHHKQQQQQHQKTTLIKCQRTLRSGHIESQR